MAPMDTPATQSWTKSATTLARARRYLQGRTLYGPPSMPTVLATTDFWSLTSTIDRKSTRLNSSHTVISYAVFCLKKKKKLLEKNRMLDTRRDPCLHCGYRGQCASSSF